MACSKRIFKIKRYSVFFLNSFQRLCFFLPLKLFDMEKKHKQNDHSNKINLLSSKLNAMGA